MNCCGFLKENLRKDGRKEGMKETNQEQLEGVLHFI